MKQNREAPTAEDMLLVPSIYEKHKGVFYRLALARAGDAADDAVSEALLRLFRNAGTLRGLHERQIVDYVAETVLSAASDLERRQRAEQRRLILLDPEEAELSGQQVSGPEEGVLETEERACRLRLLREALAELCETDRLLLVGKYLNGESDAQLAERIGVRPGSVRMKLTRARRRALRKLREGEYFSETT